MNQGALQAWSSAVGPRLDRGVRPQRPQYCGCAAAALASTMDWRSNLRAGETIAAQRDCFFGGSMRQHTPVVHRREFIGRAVGASVGIGLGLLLPGCGGDPSDNQISVPSSGGVTARSASIPQIIQYNNIDGQRTLEWCWAACAETIVRQFGIDVNNINGVSVAQEYFAVKVYGGVTSDLVQAARPDQVAYALTDTYRLLGSGQPISLHGYWYMPIPQQFNSKAVALIQAHIPFSILLIPYGSNSGHFLTVYQIDWSEDSSGNVVSINSYRMADPAQNLYQFFPGMNPYPTQWNQTVGSYYSQAGVAWAEKIG
jgi:hypothetical protein